MNFLFLSPVFYVLIPADMRFYNIDEENPTGDFKIHFPIPKISVNLFFTSPSGTRHTAINSGYSSGDHFRDRILMRSDGGGSVMSLTDLQRSDAGRYEFRDAEGNVIAVWILSTNGNGRAVGSLLSHL